MNSGSGTLQDWILKIAVLPAIPRFRGSRISPQRS
jgi:hypothetical protein